MGVFDEVRVHYRLPWPEVQNAMWQSKDTPAQFIDLYEIRADGTLWYEAYDRRYEDAEDAPLGLWMHRDNIRWEPIPWQGELEVHHYVEHKDRPGGWWYSIRFWFRDGVVKDAVFVKEDHCS